MGRLLRALVATSWIALARDAAAAPGEERIEGIVRDTVVTYCDAMRLGGCAGRLTLERQTAGKINGLTIEVPLGTPISDACGRVLLHALEGKAVIVTHVTDRGGGVALAIQVAERRDASAASGSSSDEIC